MVGWEPGGGESDEAAVLRLGSSAQDGETVKDYGDLGIDVEVLFCVSGNPGFALGRLHLQAVGGKGADPEGPYVVEEDEITGDDYIIDICKDGDEFAWAGGEAWREWKVGKVCVKFVHNGAQEYAEHGSGEALTLEYAFCDLELGEGVRGAG